MNVKDSFKKSFLIVMAISGMTCTRPEAELKIIPKPLELTVKEGFFRLTGKTKFIFTDNDEALQKGSEIFTDLISVSSTFQLQPEYMAVNIPVKNAIILSLKGDINKYGNEGYLLSVSSKLVEIESASSAGAFYGLQTLRQIFPVDLEDSAIVATTWEIPCVEIFDKPRFMWRGDMLDVSRHFLPLELII